MERTHHKETGDSVFVNSSVCMKVTRVQGGKYDRIINLQLEKNQVYHAIIS